MSISFSSITFLTSLSLSLSFCFQIILLHFLRFYLMCPMWLASWNHLKERLQYQARFDLQTRARSIDSRFCPFFTRLTSRWDLYGCRFVDFFLFVVIWVRECETRGQNEQIDVDDLTHFFLFIHISTHTHKRYWWWWWRFVGLNHKHLKRAPNINDVDNF